ncbi:MAG: DNA internalization-related competence protein ComEC/Rec2 [Nitrospinota bacterium]
MNAPILHVALCLLSGTLLSSPLAPFSVRATWGILAAAYLTYLFFNEKTRKIAWISTVALAGGLCLPHVRLPWQTARPTLPSGRVGLYARVDAPIERGRRTDRIYLRMEGAESRGGTVPLAGRARLTLYWKGADIRYGDRLRAWGVRLHRPKGFANPGSFDHETYLSVRGIFAVGGVSRPSQIAVLEREAGFPLLSSLYAFRERLASTVRSRLPAPRASVLNALLYGERRGVPRDVQTAFYDSGTGHLMAISGLHVGFVAFFLYRLLLLIGRWTPRAVKVRLPTFLTPDRFAALGTVPLVLSYMIIAGARVSTVRATIMVVTYLLARCLQRDRDHFNSLGLAALMILLWDGRFLFDAGFQLSFVAVLVILASVRTSSFKGRVGEFVRVTVLVTVAMIPILAFHFHRVTVYGVAANLMLIPLASLLVPAGLVASVLGAFSSWLAALLFPAAHFLTFLLVEGARWIADLPQAALRVRPPTPLMLLALYGGAACILLNRQKTWRRLVVGASCAVFGASIVWTAVFQTGLTRKGELGIVFLDVGDADATFVQLPDGRTLLVDAAGKLSQSFDVGEAVVVPYLERRWIRRLDYALLTHPERDHAEGLFAVMRSLSVGQIWESGLLSKNPLRDRLLQAAEKRNVPVRPLRRGMAIAGQGYRIEVLHPDPGRRAVRRRRDNDHAVILRLVHGKVRVLLASDLERRGERELVRSVSAGDLRAEVLRVPHHGSRTSSSLRLIQNVRPRAAVISAGRPWRGHPSPQVLSRYGRLGAAVFRTDRDGAVRLWSDGESYRLESTLRPRHRFHGKAGEIPPTRIAAEPSRQD